MTDFGQNPGPDFGQDLNQDYVRVNVMFDRSAANVAESLGHAGLLIEQELDLLAIITGRIPSDRMAALSSVDGVLAVEPDRGVETLGQGLGPQ